MFDQLFFFTSDLVSRPPPRRKEFISRGQEVDSIVLPWPPFPGQFLQKFPVKHDLKVTSHRSDFLHVLMHYAQCPHRTQFSVLCQIREEPLMIWRGARAKAGKKTQRLLAQEKKNSTQQPRRKNSTAGWPG